MAKVLEIGQKFFKGYQNIFEFLFFVFLFGVLSFGRAFSILYIDTPAVPLFITEILLLTALPLLISRGNFFSFLPRYFQAAVLIYFFIGGFYFLRGMVIQNPYALRDIVFCGYILFLPLTFIVFSRLRKIKILLAVLLVSNVVAVLLGRFFILDVYNVPVLRYLVPRTKLFNLSLYYGITMSLLISFWGFYREFTAKILILLLSAVNLYMLLFLGVRTSWVAVMACLVYFFFVYKVKFLKFLIIFIPFFLIVGGALYHFDFASVHKNVALWSKLKSTVIFISDVIKAKKSSVFSKGAPPGSVYKDTQADFPLGTPLYVAQKPVIYASFSDNNKNDFDSILWRVDIWKQTANFGLDSPLLGQGFGKYPSYKNWGYPLDPPKRIDTGSGILPAHNHLLAIFYKMGLVGLGLFLFINIYVLVFGLKLMGRCQSDFLRRFVAGTLSAFVFWHAMALFFDLIDSPPTSIFLWFLMGLVFAVSQIEKFESARNKA